MCEVQQTDLPLQQQRVCADRVFVDACMGCMQLCGRRLPVGAHFMGVRRQIKQS